MRARDILHGALYSIVDVANEAEFLRIGFGRHAGGRRPYGAGIALHYMHDSNWPDAPQINGRVGRVTVACWWPPRLPRSS